MKFKVVKQQNVSILKKRFGGFGEMPLGCSFHIKIII
jgi:hypothetical protein